MRHIDLQTAEKETIRKGIGIENIDIVKSIRTLTSNSLHKAIFRLINTEMSIHNMFYNNEIDEETYNNAIKRLDTYRDEMRQNTYIIKEPVDVQTIDSEISANIIFKCDMLKDLIKDED